MTPDYPAQHWEIRYGRRIWPLGEYGEEGVIIEGHDRRAYAALVAYCRGEGDLPDGKQIEKRWINGYDDSCGCTPEQHAEHQDCLDDCFDGNPGLPPCSDQFMWIVQWANSGDPEPTRLPCLLAKW